MKLRVGSRKIIQDLDESHQGSRLQTRLNIRAVVIDISRLWLIFNFQVHNLISFTYFLFLICQFFSFSFYMFLSFSFLISLDAH